MEAFSAEAVARGRRYHRPRYVSQLVEFSLSVSALCLLAFTRVGDALLPDARWWLQALVYPPLVLGLLELFQLPIAFWRDYARDRRWGLSTQTRLGWAGDRVKAFVVNAGIVTVLTVGFFAVTRSMDAWPIVVAPLAGAVVVSLTFIAPVVLEPLFNTFEPLRDRALADDLRAVAYRAGVPIRDVLVADASRRTTRQNAYVSGFGATRRVVVFDTLLDAAEPAELRAVLAHELAHRRHRDVLNLTLIGVAIAGVLVLVVWSVVADAADVRNLPLVLLLLTLAQPFLLAGIAAVLRRWEYRADRFALGVTRDPKALIRAFDRLVTANVADLDPPRLVYFLRYTHPTVPQRIAAISEAARVEGLLREEAA